jgi:hypothetical protein
VWLVAVAALLALPAVARARPARTASVVPADLAALIRSSAPAPYQGYVETRGRLELPDIAGAEDQVALLGETSHVRAWVRAPEQWRVDVLSPVGEQGTYRDGPTTIVWDSQERRARRFNGQPALRLPQAFDLLPPELGRRLLDGAAPGEIGPLAAARVAGRAVPGLRITPASTRSSVAHVDIWADPATGVPLRVRVTSRDGGPPVLESSFLDVSLASPPLATVAFRPTKGIRIRGGGTFDVTETLARQFPVPLPASLDGLALTAGGTGLGVYGQGFDTVAVIGLPAFLLTRVVSSVVPITDRPWGGKAQVVETPLVNAIAVTPGPIAYVAAGPVSVATLDRIAATLASTSPTGAPA